MRSAVLPFAAALLSMACGEPPATLAEPTSFDPGGAPGLAEALDATPLDVPTRLPSLEVAGAPNALSLDVLDVKVTVAGRLARTEVTQVFRNSLPRQVEGTYEMFLPEAAVISRLAMDVDGVMTEGELAEKERARQIYESIVHARKDPALLEWQGGNRFKMQVFPIPASGTKTIVLEYEELLPVRGRRVQYAYGLPTVAPGAGPGIGRFAFQLRSSDAGTPTLDADGGSTSARVEDNGVRAVESAFLSAGRVARSAFPVPPPAAPRS